MANWERRWDPRLTSLRVFVRADPEQVDYTTVHWRISHAWLILDGDWETAPDWARAFQDDTLGGAHHAYGRAVFADGTVANQAAFVLRWPDGADGRAVEDNGWANIPLYAAYDPEKGPGPYTWAKAGNAEALAGLGLPYTLRAAGGHHVSFFAVWQEVVPGEGSEPEPPEEGDWVIYDIRWSGLALEGVQVRRRSSP